MDRAPGRPIEEVLMNPLPGRDRHSDERRRHLRSHPRRRSFMSSNEPL